ncbi:MAG: dihydroorotase [Burkholderiaceae bacterium]|nr:dihydroorotase [Burkholderiaceae bacterium]
MTPPTLTLTRPDDWHLHLRDGAAMADVLPYTARQFARAIVMPNLKPPVTTTALAAAYRARIRAALPAGMRFEPLMTLYLTDNTAPDEIRAAKASGFVHGVKLYPAGATTNSDFGVTSLKKCARALEAMQAVDLPLLVHGEVTHAHIDVFDRERAFIDEVLIPTRRDFPALRVVFEHITTKDAAEYVAQADGRIAATITAHHLLYNRNRLFMTGDGKTGMRPHWYCLPVLKREAHRQALLAVLSGGSPRFFLGTDSAPHAKGEKESACGCAGCFTAASAIEMYAMAFEEIGALDKLEAFASFHGPDFYGLPRNTQTVTLARRDWTPPAELKFGDTTLVPLAAGETLPWQLVA